jgi:putative hydrolase of the HAD superfamily
MIKNLIFDLGGVVIKLNPSEAYSRFEKLGISDARQQMGVYGQTGIFKAVEDGSIDADEFCRQLALQAQLKSNQFFGEPSPFYSFEQAKWAWLGYVREVPLERLNNLLKLKEDFNVSLLSNTNPFIMDWAESSGFSGDGHPISFYFHNVYCSCRLSDYKPSRSIYEKVLALSGYEACETIFVDDGPENITAAESLGIHGLLVEKDADWMEALLDMVENYR